MGQLQLWLNSMRKVMDQGDNNDGSLSIKGMSLAEIGERFGDNQEIPFDNSMAFLPLPDSREPSS